MFSGNLPSQEVFKNFTPIPAGGWLDADEKPLISESYLEKLTYWQLRELSKQVNRFKKAKFPDRKQRLFGNMNKGFTDEEADLFFMGFKPGEVKEKLAFLVQRFTGRRISEVVRLKITDIDWELRYLRFKRSKIKGGTAVFDFVRIVDKLFFPLLDFVESYRKEILAHQGFVFFSSNPVQKREHLSKDYLRKVFREVTFRTGLAEPRGNKSELPKGAYAKNKKGYCLYRLSTHSFRHSFISKALFDKQLPLGVVSQLVGHSDIKSTMSYVHTPQEVLDMAIESMWQK